MSKKTIRILASLFLTVLLVLLSYLFFVKEERNLAYDAPEQTYATAPMETQATVPDVTEESTEPPTTEPEETEPEYVKTSITLSAIGDIMLHDAVMDSCYDRSSKTYDFSSIFTYVSDHLQAADYAVVNFEGTLGGSSYGISGYPMFNSPDSILDGLKNAGVDILLTANNHCYDTYSEGLHRTMDKVTESNLLHLGTKKNAEDPNYIILEQGEIRIGLACYTYETSTSKNSKYINGIPVKQGDAALINSFNLHYLDSFYDEADLTISQMKEEGVDAIVYFMHWGSIYSRKVNSQQLEISQKLCDLGVDVIIGGHPHVVQAADLLTSTQDDNHKTVCLYSMGNAVSNQRGIYTKEVPTKHTEDGVMFQVTFTQQKDGTVVLESAEAIPIWVNMATNPKSGKKEYNILPLDKSIQDWKTAFDLTDATLADAQASYERSMELVGSGMAKINAYLAN